MALKKLSEFLNAQHRTYHFTYDVREVEKNFDNYAEAKNYLLCVFSQTPLTSITAVNASTLILEYNKPQTRLFEYLKENLSKHFYYVISAIDKNKDNLLIMQSHRDATLGKNFEVEWKNLECATKTMQKITPY